MSKGLLKNGRFSHSFDLYGVHYSSMAQCLISSGFSAMVIRRDRTNLKKVKCITEIIIDHTQTAKKAKERKVSEEAKHRAKCRIAVEDMHNKKKLEDDYWSFV